MTGQTPKGQGVTLGSLKQLVATYQTAEYLKNQGIDTDVVFVNADGFVPDQSCYPQKFDEMVEGFKSEYGEVEAVRTSELDESVESPREDLVEKVNDNLPFVSGYANDYSLDEVAVIRQISELGNQGLVKVGPPQERPYDEIFADAFPNTDFEGVYLTPTVPLTRGMNSEQIQGIEDQGGVIPYHDYGSRIKLSNDQIELDEKRKDASHRVRKDVEAVKEFLDNKSGTRSLSEHFRAIINEEKTPEPAPRSIFEHE